MSVFTTCISVQATLDMKIPADFDWLESLHYFVKRVHFSQLLCSIQIYRNLLNHCPRIVRNEGGLSLIILPTERSPPLKNSLHITYFVLYLSLYFILFCIIFCSLVK